MCNWWAMSHTGKRSADDATDLSQLVDRVIGSPVDEVVTGAPIKRKKYQGRSDRSGKTMLRTSSGLSYFAHDNWDRLNAKFGGKDISGGVRLTLRDRFEDKTFYYVSQEFMDFVNEQLDRFNRDQDPKTAGDDDMNGNRLDGATTGHFDHPSGRKTPKPHVLKKGRCSN